MRNKFTKVATIIFMLGYSASHSVGYAQVQTLTPNMKQAAPISILADLQNFQVNTRKMVSSGLPTFQHFEALKALGVTSVIDLIPGDRSEEARLMETLDIPYYNIPVDWENPTLENFDQYVVQMNHFTSGEGITLTHCQLNWRGAVFTYLYRTTVLNEPEESAKKNLVAIWSQPNDIWQAFIDKVQAKYMKATPPVND